MSGLSSGEGLVWHVRDPIEKQQAVKEGGRSTGQFEMVVVDEGVEDKRLVVHEPEFASVLKVMARETNTLSTQIRQAWDTGNLRIMTKNSPAVATDAHVSILGHITKGELSRHLTETELANGFANRFLWGCTKRAQVLPDGGGTPDYRDIVPQLHRILEGAREVRELSRDAETRAAWAEVYPQLSEGKPGMFGAITARAEAQVLRLEVLYAVLDGAQARHLNHLKAALAVWEYTEESVRYIFGDATGDPVADRILEGLRTFGEMTRTQVSQLFHRNGQPGSPKRCIYSSLRGALDAKSGKRKGGLPSYGQQSRVRIRRKKRKTPRTLFGQIRLFRVRHSVVRHGCLSRTGSSIR